MDFSEYAIEVDKAFDRLVSRKNVTDFVTELERINNFWVNKFSRDGYNSAGGIGDAADNAADNAAKFTNYYITRQGGFRDSLLQDIQAGVDLEHWRWRAFMYPNEAHRLAFVNGQQEAMRERGAKSWQRELHPELSETGPCELCIEDSKVIHSINEWFMPLHPGDVCSVKEVIVYYPEAPEEIKPGTKPMLKIPIPRIFPPIAQMIKDFLKEIKDVGTTLIKKLRRK